MFRGLGNYRGASGFSTWLFSIAFHEVADYYRASKRCREETWEEFFDAENAATNRPEAKLLRSETQSRLLEALDTLSQRDRRIVELRYFAGLQQKEIADVMEVSQSNVGVILHRALVALKKMLETVSK